MIENKKLFIDAGINYIFDLESYPIELVESQVDKELDEVLELNNPEILQDRCNYFSIGFEDDYLNSVIDTPQGPVIAGIRHLGGDKRFPFVYVWPSFCIEHIEDISDEIISNFKIFEPKYISFWVRPDKNKLKGEVYQQRFIGNIAEMNKNNTHLSKCPNYYDWYTSEYEKFHKQNPEKKHRIPVNDKELMDKCLRENLLFLYSSDNDEQLGLIAGEYDTFLGKSAVYLNEILVSYSERGKGYSANLLSGFVNLLDVELFLCHIDSTNIPSTKAAIRSGQRVFSQEIFIRTS